MEEGDHLKWPGLGQRLKYIYFLRNCPRLDLFIRDMGRAGAALSESRLRTPRRENPTKKILAIVATMAMVALIWFKVQVIIIFYDIFEVVSFFAGLSEKLNALLLRYIARFASAILSQ